MPKAEGGLPVRQRLRGGIAEPVWMGSGASGELPGRDMP